MIQQRLYEWIKHPEMLNRDTLYELRTLLARYPYFQTARLLYLKNLFLLHDFSFGEELRKAALYVSDRRILFQLVEGERFSKKALEVHKALEMDMGLDRTMSLIDAFLSTLPEEEGPVYGKEIPMDVSTDYTAYLMQEPDALETSQGEVPKLQGQEWIDDFLEKSAEEPILPQEKEEKKADVFVKQTEQQKEETDEILDDESYLTETLAKIYVKQQRYSKALEIIRKLNLKYPKKNAYFADQIRFLEKLIINAKSE